MGLSSSMSKWCLVVLNIASMLSNSLMVIMMWKLMGLNDDRLVVYLVLFHMRNWSVMDVMMSIVETVVKSMMWNLMVFWCEMTIFSLPVVSMAMIDNMVEAVFSISSMVKSMSKSMVESMWLIVKTVLNMVCIVSKLGVSIIMVWIHIVMTNLMGPLVVHVVGDLSEVV